MAATNTLSQNIGILGQKVLAVDDERAMARPGPAHLMMRHLCLVFLKCGSGNRKNIFCSCTMCENEKGWSSLREYVKWRREEIEREMESEGCRGANLPLAEEVGQKLHGIGAQDADVLVHSLVLPENMR
jgi:hypothetical protein